MIETSGHLPECSYTSGIWYSLDEDCICPALLACEQRVRDERQDDLDLSASAVQGRGGATDT